MSALSHPAITFAPTGGNRAGSDDVRQARDAIEEVARSAGYPGPLGSEAARGFDLRCGRALYGQLRIVTADAANDGVWAFLTCVVVPHLACWRFSRRTAERILGGPRNTFRRLWWRERVLGDDHGERLEQLNEDELVQIMERPSLGGNGRVAGRLCDLFRQLVTTRNDLPRMELMRDATKRLIRLTPSVSLMALDDEALDAVLGDAFESAAAVLTGTEAPSGHVVGGIHPTPIPASEPVAADSGRGENQMADVDPEADVHPSKQAESIEGAKVERSAAPVHAGAGLHVGGENGSFVPLRPRAEPRTPDAPFLADIPLDRLQRAAVEAVERGATNRESVIERVPEIVRCEGNLTRAEGRLVNRVLWTAVRRGWVSEENGTFSSGSVEGGSDHGPLPSWSLSEIANAIMELLDSHPGPHSTATLSDELLNQMGSPDSGPFIEKTVRSVLVSMSARGLIQGDLDSGWSR